VAGNPLVVMGRPPRATACCKMNRPASPLPALKRISLLFVQPQSTAQLTMIDDVRVRMVPDTG
jgi:hypothetical protein